MVEEEFEIHEQCGYFLIVCPNCNDFIKGTTEKHVRSNFKIHRESVGCEILARDKRALGGGGDDIPILQGTAKEKLNMLNAVYKSAWFYEEMKEDLEKEKD